MRQELVERNVAELVTTPRQRRRKVAPWTSEEARRFLESARADGDPMYAAFVLVLVLGLRKGEVLGLRWDAVDFDAGELVVDHQLQRFALAAVPSDEDRVLGRLAAVYRTLWQRPNLRRIDQERSHAAAAEAWRRVEGEPDLVFTGRYGTPVDPRTLNDRFTRRCDLAGVRRLTVHDARRTCATLLVDLDVHPRVIMRILRHSDQAVTMQIYAQASSDATRDALRRLGEALR